MIEYRANFVDDPDVLLAWTQQKIVWRSEYLRRYGGCVSVPRLIAWFGDSGIQYTYSGVLHEGNGWPTPLAGLRDLVLERTELETNFVLLNRYRDGNDGMGWHTDDETEMSGLVASITLGFPRRFHVDLGADAGCVTTCAHLPQWRALRTPGRYALTPEHGSLLLFSSGIPHALPKRRSEQGERINLTFRRVAVP